MEAIGLAFMAAGFIGALAQLWLIPRLFDPKRVRVVARRGRVVKVGDWRYEPPEHRLAG